MSTTDPRFRTHVEAREGLSGARFMATVIVVAAIVVAAAALTVLLTLL